MEKWRLKAEKARNEERKYLLGLTDGEAEKLSNSDKYQRIRYQREIDAAVYLEEVRRKMPPEVAEEARRRDHEYFKVWESL
jgi:hypothetical protein